MEFKPVFPYEDSRTDETSDLSLIVDKTLLEELLGIALQKGGRFAEIYAERKRLSHILLDEDRVKSTRLSFSQGLGVRVISGEETGYAYSNDLSPEKLKEATKTASLISDAPQSTLTISLDEKETPSRYRMVRKIHTEPESSRVELSGRANASARNFDKRIKQVTVVLVDEVTELLIANSEGVLTTDFRPLIRLAVSTVSENNGLKQSGFSAGGGRVGFEVFDALTPESIGEESARMATAMLDARDAPAGEMEVVIGPGWGGVLLHEAVGHGLEADFNRKGTSLFAGRIGERVASALVTVVDDATIPGKRGTLNVDDEGETGKRTVLIEEGILVGYMHDRLNAKLMRAQSTGNGRRESYRHIPIPRMTNTFMEPGKCSHEEIIASVKKGVFARNLGGGQVDISNGNFVFTVSEGYLIEGGKITAPIKNATLIGNGPEIMRKVVMVGKNLKFDDGIGTCGKDGQLVPVGLGLPTVKISSMTVGGTSAS